MNKKKWYLEWCFKTFEFNRKDFREDEWFAEIGEDRDLEMEHFLVILVGWSDFIWNVKEGQKFTKEDIENDNCMEEFTEDSIIEWLNEEEGSEGLVKRFKELLLENSITELLAKARTKLANWIRIYPEFTHYHEDDYQEEGWFTLKKITKKEINKTYLN